MGLCQRYYEVIRFPLYVNGIGLFYNTFGGVNNGWDIYYNFMVPKRIGNSTITDAATAVIFTTGSGTLNSTINTTVNGIRRGILASGNYWQGIASGGTIVADAEL